MWRMSRWRPWPHWAAKTWKSVCAMEPHIGSTAHVWPDMLVAALRRAQLELHLKNTFPWLSTEIQSELSSSLSLWVPGACAGGQGQPGPAFARVAAALLEQDEQGVGQRQQCVPVPVAVVGRHKALQTATALNARCALEEPPKMSGATAFDKAPDGKPLSLALELQLMQAA